jgi:hypothetical protein
MWGRLQTDSSTSQGLYKKGRNRAAELTLRAQSADTTLFVSGDLTARPLRHVSPLSRRTPGGANTASLRIDRQNRISPGGLKRQDGGWRASYVIPFRRSSGCGSLARQRSSRACTFSHPAEAGRWRRDREQVADRAAAAKTVRRRLQADAALRSKHGQKERRGYCSRPRSGAAPHEAHGSSSISNTSPHAAFVIVLP